MARYMTPRMARAKIVEDSSAPLKIRIAALREIHRPPLAMLRRLIVDSKTRAVPVPPRLKALALMRYVQEVEKRKIRTGNGRKSSKVPDNALGIV